MPSQTSLDITVGGRWLSLDCLYGDIQMDTIWPGGSDELSWALGTQPAARFTGGEPVVGYYGGSKVWGGTMVEPDPSQDRSVATGLWRLGDKFPAIGPAGGASSNPDVAIDQAILRNLAWTKPASVSGVAVAIDISQGPVTVNELLDMWAENNQTRWTVSPAGVVFATNDDTTPTYKTVPMEGGLGYALDNYASTIIARYLDSATSTFKTLPAVTDTTAESLHGHVEALVDLTGRGAITSTVATNIANSILNQGRSTPQWTQPIEVTYGEILTMGGTPVALESVAAGEMVRVPGGFELAQRKNGAMYVDVLIGHTSLSDGTLTLQPLQIATRSVEDIWTEALSKRKKKQAS